MRLEKVLVTGGAGFIGSHVCERLLALGCLPLVLDNFSTGKTENLPTGCEVAAGDIRDASLLNDLCLRVDSVVHLAAEPSVALSVEQPVETHGSNYVGTLNLLEAMRQTGLRRIVYASSAAVYPPSDSASSEDGPVRPSSPYGLDKLMGEHALRIYQELYGIRGTSLRFFNIYGERQDPTSPYSGVISIFLSRFLQGKAVTIFGSWEQTRDFVYVRDLASLIVRMIDDPASPGLMNVGTGKRTSLLDLIATLEHVLGRRAEVRHEEGRAGDILHSLADTRTLQAGGWLPATTLEEGLTKLVESLPLPAMATRSPNG